MWLCDWQSDCCWDSICSYELLLLPRVFTSDTVNKWRFEGMQGVPKLPITTKYVNAKSSSEIFVWSLQDNDYFKRVGVVSDQNNSGGTPVAVNWGGNFSLRSRRYLSDCDYVERDLSYMRNMWISKFESRCSLWSVFRLFYVSKLRTNIGSRNVRHEEKLLQLGLICKRWSI